MESSFDYSKIGCHVNRNAIKIVLRFHWRFFYRNRGRDLKLSDIPKGRRVDGSNYVYNEFIKYWNAEEARAQKSNRRPNLARAIFRQYGLELFVLGLFCFVAVSFHFLMIIRINSEFGRFPKTKNLFKVLLHALSSALFGRSDR